MQNTFNINYDGKQVQAELVNLDEEKGSTYKVMLNNTALEIKEMKDSDGASRWLEANKEHETEESKKIGAAIEKYLAE